MILIRSSEIAIRAFISERAELSDFDRKYLRLESVFFSADQVAHMFYAGLGLAVVVGMDRTGKFVTGPTVVHSFDDDD